MTSTGLHDNNRPPKMTSKETCLEKVLCISIGRISTGDDVLLPYTEGHGPSHSHRHVRDCQAVTHGRTTYETWPSSSHDTHPVAQSTVFISDMEGGPDRSRWVYGQ